MKRMLVPIDGSSAAAHALARGIELAKSAAASLAVCAVVDPKTLTGHQTPHFSDRSMMEASKAEANELVRGAVARAAAQGVAAEGIVLTGDSCEEIVRYAHEAGTDTIVMGTHGRTGFRRLHVGSVARGVLRCAGCEVITVREAADQESEAAPPMPQSFAYEAAVFMVRLLEVKPENFDRLYGDMTRFANESCDTVPGIVSSQIFGSDDSTRILIIVEFRSYEDWVRSQWDPRLASSVEEVALLSETLDFELYRGARFTPATTSAPDLVSPLGE